jgi:hypothetical protein
LSSPAPPPPSAAVAAPQLLLPLLFLSLLLPPPPPPPPLLSLLSKKARVATEERPEPGTGLARERSGSGVLGEVERACEEAGAGVEEEVERLRWPLSVPTENWQCRAGLAAAGRAADALARTQEDEVI